MRPPRDWALIATAAGVPAALAWWFALEYRSRAGTPEPHPPTILPTALGLGFEEQLVSVREGHRLPAWFIPANEGRPGPGVLLVHGWESARDRMLPNAVFLHAAGFHVLTIDVRGHGANPREKLPITSGEFAADAIAGFAALLDRPEVTRGAILGHSIGSVGALLAAAADPRVAAVVATSTPASPLRVTRETFRAARLPIPAPVAWPLAWLTTRVYLEPRGHTRRSISSETALQRYGGPVLLVHGEADRVVPVAHQARLATVARRVPGRPVHQLVIAAGQHSWLYEDSGYRQTVADFLARTLDGPLPPAEAARRAGAAAASRLDGEDRLQTIEAVPRVVRSVMSIVAGDPPRHRPAEPPRTGRRPPRT